MSSSERIEHLASLRKELIVFIEELLQLLPQETELIVMKSFAKTVIIKDVMEYIIKNIVPLEPKVIARDDGYFLHNAAMFERLQNRESQVNHFKMLWENNPDPHNREMVWNWLEHFIWRAKEYKRKFIN